MVGLLESRGQRKLHLAVGERILNAIQDPHVIEILLNEDGRLWVEFLNGGMGVVGDMSATDGMSLLSTVAASLNTVVTPLSPVVEGELDMGELRFEGLIPPVVRAPVFSIRKHAVKPLLLSDYAADETLLSYQCKAIEFAVERRSNILVSGGTSSGKTTFARCLLYEIAARTPEHRIITIEDTPELNTPSENSVSLKVSPGATAQELLRATMRLRPDRIVVGEVRGGEALTLLKAWNTGHPGGVSTIHANSARGALTRLEQLVAEVSASPIPHVIADAVDLIVHLERSPLDGVRRVVEVVSVEGYSDGEYLINPIKE
jgi:type IV secretion system protein VirB11